MDDTISVADRIFTILETLAYAQKPLSLSALTQGVGMSKTTVHRLLGVLYEKGYVAKNLDGHYSLGTKYIELASYHINSLELQAEANPFLSLLYSQLNLSVHLGVLENFQLVYIKKIDQFPTKQGFAHIGYETPAYCSSIGKILLASLSGAEFAQFLTQCEFQQFTPRTLTTPEALKAHLRIVRSQGWAMDCEEYQAGHCCMAVPIYDYRGNTIAGVGVSGFADAFTADKQPAIIRELTQVAQQISKRMGYS